MQREHVNTAVVGAWMLACGVMALSVDVSSASSWIILVGSAALPPLMLSRLWHQPAQIMSQRIREALK